MIPMMFFSISKQPMPVQVLQVMRDSSARRLRSCSPTHKVVFIDWRIYILPPAGVTKLRAQQYFIKLTTRWFGVVLKTKVIEGKSNKI